MKTKILAILCFCFPALTLAQESIDRLGADAFDSVVSPFLQKHCNHCHSGSGAESGIDLSNMGQMLDSAEQASIWLKTLEQLQAG